MSGASKGKKGPDNAASRKATSQREEAVKGAGRSTSGELPSVDQDAATEKLAAETSPVESKEEPKEEPKPKTEEHTLPVGDAEEKTAEKELTAWQKLDPKIRYSAVLLAVCFVSVVSVLVVLVLTYARIERLKKEGERKALAVVLGTHPDSVNFQYRQCKTDDGFPLKMRVFGDPAGTAAFQFDVTGYGGRVSLMAGVRGDQILGISVLPGHEETPGLGARISEVKASGTWWDSAMTNRSLRLLVGWVFIALAALAAWKLVRVFRERANPLNPIIRPGAIAVTVWVLLPLAAFFSGLAALTHSGALAPHITESVEVRPWFQEQFSTPPRTIETLVLKKTEKLGPDYIASLSGATITTTAIWEGLVRILGVAEEMRQDPLHESFLKLPIEPKGEGD